MPIRYTHTNIVSRDWRKLAKFYKDVFDCVPVPPERKLSGKCLDRGIGIENTFLDGIHLRLPGFGESGPTLEIFRYETIEGNLPQRANRKGFSHIAFHVDDVREIRAKVIAHGGSEVGRIASKEIEGVGCLTFVYMADPDGNIIEIQNWA